MWNKNVLTLKLVWILTLPTNHLVLCYDIKTAITCNHLLK